MTENHFAVDMERAGQQCNDEAMLKAYDEWLMLSRGALGSRSSEEAFSYGWEQGADWQKQAHAAQLAAQLAAQAERIAALETALRATEVMRDIAGYFAKRRFLSEQAIEEVERADVLITAALAAAPRPEPTASQVPANESQDAPRPGAG